MDHQDGADIWRNILCEIGGDGRFHAAQGHAGQHDRRGWEYSPHSLKLHDSPFSLEARNGLPGYQFRQPSHETP
jgi:hypothetical protein